jgi:hypothetical protein
MLGQPSFFNMNGDSMENLAIIEDAVDTSKVATLLGAAGAYLATGGLPPAWDPETEYQKDHSRADVNPVQ